MQYQRNAIQNPDIVDNEDFMSYIHWGIQGAQGARPPLNFPFPRFFFKKMHYSDPETSIPTKFF